MDTDGEFYAKKNSGRNYRDTVPLKRRSVGCVYYKTTCFGFRSRVTLTMTIINERQKLKT